MGPSRKARSSGTDIVGSIGDGHGVPEGAVTVDGKVDGTTDGIVDGTAEGIVVAGPVPRPNSPAPTATTARTRTAAIASHDGATTPRDLTTGADRGWLIACRTSAGVATVVSSR